MNKLTLGHAVTFTFILLTVTIVLAHYLGRASVASVGVYVYIPIWAGAVFGRRGLYVAQIASLACFLYVYGSVEWWQYQSRELVFGWLAAIAAVPAYVAMRFLPRTRA